MSEGRLDSRELDAIVAREDAAGPGTPQHTRSKSPGARVGHLLSQPVVALLAVLLVVGAVLGVRSYVVNRPPPLASSVDAKIGASFGQTGFITLVDDGQGFLLSLVLRGDATRRPLDVVGFLGPGLADVGVHRVGERVTVSGTTDCATVPTAPEERETTGYRMQVVALDAWQRELRAELLLPSSLSAQLAGAIRLSCLANSVRAVRLEELTLGDTGAAVARLVNEGTELLYLHVVTVTLENEDGSAWMPRVPSALPAGGRAVDVTLVARGADCASAPTRARPSHTVVAWLSVSADPEALLMDVHLPVPVGSQRTVRAMTTAPCDPASP